MSYCRWSSDNFTCDLYIYESVYDCWTIHVASSRHVGPLPEYPTALKLASGEIDLAEYRAMHDRWDAWTEEHGMETIDLPGAGETFDLPTPGECADKVEALRALGFKCPDYVIPALREEQAELDAASRIEARSDETPQEVRPEGREPDPPTAGDAQNQSRSNPEIPNG